MPHHLWFYAKYVLEGLAVNKYYTCIHFVYLRVFKAIHCCFPLCWNCNTRGQKEHIEWQRWRIKAAPSLSKPLYPQLWMYSNSWGHYSAYNCVPYLPVFTTPTDISTSVCWAFFALLPICQTQPSDKLLYDKVDEWVVYGWHVGRLKVSERQMEGRLQEVDVR